MAFFVMASIAPGIGQVYAPVRQTAA